MLAVRVFLTPCLARRPLLWLKMPCERTAQAVTAVPANPEPPSLQPQGARARVRHALIAQAHRDPNGLLSMRYRDDNYSDLVEAGAAIFCAALLLVAFFLFILPKVERPSLAAPQVHKPGAPGEVSAPLISSNGHEVQE
jgi:hypothetical protein